MARNLPQSVRHSPDLSLVLLTSQFQRAVRPLLVEASGYALAGLRRRATPQSCELLADAWRHTAERPRGQDHGALADWLVLAISDGSGMTPERLLELVEPGRSQTVVAIVLDRRERRQLPAQVWDQGILRRLTEVTLVGAAPIHLKEGTDNENELARSTPVDDPATLRASRTRGALGALYDELAAQRVLLVGAGRGGALLAQSLVAAGVRSLTIVDGDRLGAENVDAMPFTAPHEQGESKARLLAAAILRNQPEMALSAVSQPVHSPEGARLLRERRFDLLITFVDSPIPRLCAALAGQETLSVHLDVGTHIAIDDQGQRQMTADVRLFEPRRGCCLCVPPLEQLEEALYELSAPDQALKRGESLPWNALRAGSLYHLNALACSLAVETWLGYLAGDIRTSVWRRVRWQGGEIPRIESALIDGDPGCKYCQGSVQ
ncbi:MAG: ThiF family adenylyltransferase [Planctomycetales bacterium]